MSGKAMRLVLMMIVIGCGLVAGNAPKNISFFDDFEKGLGKWDLVNADKIYIKDSTDPRHGKVMCLNSGGEAVYALIKDSHDWTNIRVEGDVYFPHEYFSYMGLIYNYNVRGRRTDFGSIFLLAPYADELEPYFQNLTKYMEWPPDDRSGNIILVNPHRDSNSSRMVYSEYWVALTAEKTLKPGEWGHFKGEIVGPACHFYVTDMETPQITYDFFEFSTGRVGFKPRFLGAPVWIDNIRVTSIKELSYKGPILPKGIVYKPEKLVTDWQVLGPFDRRMKEIEADGCLPEKTYRFQDQTYEWQPFETDPRGCVVSGRVTERFSGRLFAYFHTEIVSPEPQEVSFEFSSNNPLVLWVNHKLVGDVKAQLTSWYDFRENPDHAGEKVKVSLVSGSNRVMVLVKGGRYSGDAFYLYCRKSPPEITGNTK